MGQKLSIRNQEKTIKLVASFKVPYPELGEGGKKAYFLHFFFSPLVQVKAPVFTQLGKIFRAYSKSFGYLYVQVLSRCARERKCLSSGLKCSIFVSFSEISHCFEIEGPQP